MKAIDSFDPQKGIRLSSYTARCVENEILMYFRSKKKTAQDISLSEPIDTDKDGNVLTLMDTLASGEDIIDTLDVKSNRNSCTAISTPSSAAANAPLSFCATVFTADAP